MRKGLVASLMLLCLLGGGVSRSFADCPPLAEAEDCASLPGYIAKVCVECGVTPVTTYGVSGGSAWDQLVYGSTTPKECDLPSDILIAALCSYIDKCEKDCESLTEIIRQTQQTLGRLLTPEEILGLIACMGGCTELGCEPCGTESCPMPTEEPACTCEALVDLIICRQICAAVSCGRPITGLEIADSICDFVTQCSSSMTCYQAIGCIEDYGYPIDWELILGLVQCTACGLCGEGEEACNAKMPPDCDANGDGQITCEDLKIIIVIEIICSIVNGCEPPDDERLLEIAMEFYCGDPTPCASFTCSQITECLQELGFSGEAICVVLACSECTDSLCVGSSCELAEIIGFPSSPPPCDGTTGAAEIVAIIRQAICCRDADPSCEGEPSEEEIVELACALVAWLDACRSDLDVCEALEEVLLALYNAGLIDIMDDQTIINEILLCSGCEPEITDSRDPGIPEEQDGNIGGSDCGGGGSGRSGDAGRDGRGGTKGGGGGGGSSTTPNDSGTVCLAVYPSRCGRNPVGYASGTKIESVVDLGVSLVPRDFELVRSYSSQSDPSGNAMLGAGWTTSAMRFIVVDQANCSGSPLPDTVWLYGPGRRERRTYTRVGSGSSAEWRTTGPGTQYFTRHAVTTETFLQGHTYVWRFHEPGAYTTDFADDCSAVGPLAGHLLQTTDIYGRSEVYSYLEVGPSTDKVVRLASIHLGLEAGATDHSQAAATVVFDWHLTGDAGQLGRLKQVGVWRRMSAGLDSILTNRVEYLYHPATTPRGWSTQLGSTGDLLQVTHSTLLNQDGPDATPRYHSRITQYRYFAGTYPTGTPPETNRYEVYGEDHQLRLVITPEQVEYFAQRWVETAGGDVVPIGDRLHAAAAQLMTLDDAGSLGLGAPDAAAKLADLSSKIVGYDDTGRVRWEYLQTDCGCSGSAQKLRQLYEYYGTFPPAAQGDELGVRITEQVFGTSTFADHRIMHIDLQALGTGKIPYVISDVVSETGSTPRQWVTHYEYDDSGSPSRNLLVKKHTPSAMNSYAPFDSGTPGTPAYTPKAADGLVYGYSYTADNRPNELRISKGDPDWGTDPLDITGFDLIWSATYNSTKSWLAAEIRSYRTSTDTTSVGNDDVEVVTHTFGFHGSTDALAYHQLSVEAELVGENGPDSATTYDSFTLYNPDGQVRWQKAADGALTYFEYDTKTGALTKVVRNADPASPDGSSADALDGSDFGGVTITGWGRVADGGELVTNYINDLLGRTTKRTSPGGVSSYTIRTQREAVERPGLRYYATLSLPHRLVPGGSDPMSFDGPATVSISSAGGGTVQSSDYELNTTSAYDPEQGLYFFKYASGSPVEISRSTVQHNMSGQSKSTRRWHNVLGNQFYTDSFTYDALGRLETSTNDNGTITKYLDHDVLDRPRELQVGTNNTNMVTVAKYFYDSGGTTTEGAANGNLTRVEAYADGLSTRVTKTTLDYRDRSVLVEPPLGPYELVMYDNLDRVIERGVYSSVPTIGSSLPTTDRGLRSKTFYSQRGLRYKQQVAIDPTDDGDGFLESHAWFDEVGRTVAEWMPNSAASKRTIDGHGRPMVVYTTDRDGDDAPATTGNLADALDVTGDHVLEQTEYTYSPNDRVELVTHWARKHDSSATGALTSSEAIASYVGYCYDLADRQIRTVNFGTNDAAVTGAPTGVFKNGTVPSGSSTPPWPPTSGVVPGWGSSDPYADQIVTGTTYNARGLVETTLDPYPGDPTGSGDPKSRATKVIYDDLSRRIAVIENYDDAVIGWNSGATPARWEVVSGLDDAQPDWDRVTSFVYDGSGNVVQQVAHTPKSDDTEQVQVTQYVYGITAPTTPGDMDSLVNSNDILAEVRYPTESGSSAGEPGTTDEFKVKYAYNRLGELRAVTDQNETVHLYARDSLGRVLRDDATVASGNPQNIDTAVRAIEVDFDPFGRLETVKSRSVTGGTGGNILNAVEFTYTDLWQVREVIQDVDGDLGTSTNSVPSRTVTYHYDTQVVGSGNYSRLQELEYPDGSKLDHDYETASWDSDISRNSRLSLDLGGTPLKLARYYYVGHSMSAAVAYIGADIDLDRTMSPDGKRNFSGHTSQSSGVYPGWDRFGRVRYHAWVDGALNHNSTTNLPDRPQLVAEAYTYDHASNRLSKYDDRSGLPWASQDNQYVYDGLDRLIEARRGRWTGSALTPAAGVAGSSQQWNLDMLGNWSKFSRDLTGNGAYTDARNTTTPAQGDLIDDRDHNQANEVEESAIRHDGTTYPGAAVPFAYDDAGNIRTARMETTDTLYDQSGHSPNLVSRTYTHDAWNRMVKVESNNGTPGSSGDDYQIAEYKYNGLHWRVLKRFDVRDTPSGAPSTVQDRVMVYDASWRLIHQETDDGVDPADPVADGGWAPDRAEQLFWGNRYIDDAVARQRSTGSITDGDGEAPVITWNTPQWYLTDTQFSVVAILDPALANGPDVIERVRYDPYGRATHMQVSDFNGSGNNSIDDLNVAFLGAYFGNELIADFNRTGNITTGDLFDFIAVYFAPGHDAPEDQVSSPASDGNDNVVGYCGYIHNPETGDYAVRFRTYLPRLGRWGERDPKDYVNGMNIHEYVRSRSTIWRDPTGLDVTIEETAAPKPFGGHLRACVDVWSDDCTTITGKRCIAFGSVRQGCSVPSDATESGKSESAPSASSGCTDCAGSESHSSGSESQSCGSSVSDSCDADTGTKKSDSSHDGVVYQDTDPSIRTVRTRKTSCAYDREVLKQFNKLIGRMADYDLGSNDCRDVARRLFDDPFEPDPLSKCRPYYLPGDPRPGDKYKHLLPLAQTNTTDKSGQTNDPALIKFLQDLSCKDKCATTPENNDPSKK